MQPGPGPELGPGQLAPVPGPVAATWHVPAGHKFMRQIVNMVNGLID